MSRMARWLSFGLLAVTLLLFQVVQQQAEQLSLLARDTDAYGSAMAEIQAELEATRVELAVRNVLDSNGLNVPPERKQAVASSIIEIGQRYELSPELILAVIFTESRFDVAAESEKGAIGLMQLMPATASAIAQELEVEWKGGQLLTDPQVNILLGSFYLRRMIHRFDDLDTALAAYNVGPTKLQTLIREQRRTPQRYASQVQQVRNSLLRDYF